MTRFRDASSGCRLSRSAAADSSYMRFMDFDGTEQTAAVSPDGKFVAVLASRGGQIDAWVGEIGTGVYRNLTHGTMPELVNPSIRTLGFSADSSLVSIWTRKGDVTQPQDVNIYAAPTAGGPLVSYLKDAAELAWSRDGRRLAYHTTAPGDPIFVRERGAAAAHRLSGRDAVAVSRPGRACRDAGDGRGNSETSAGAHVGSDAKIEMCHLAREGEAART